jgi:putative PIN family toxin of toxin-antitoxin system
MLKAVIDTSVLISGVYITKGKPARVLELARKKAMQNITSPFILAELDRILRDKFLWEEKKIKGIVGWVRSFSEIVQPEESLSVISHASDNRILECALAGGADFIISGDSHLTDLEFYQGVKIVNPAAFLDAIEEREE